MPTTSRAAIIGSGNIGTDLMHKLRRSPVLEVAAMVGIDPASDGLARAAALGVAVTAAGVNGLLAMPGFDDVDVIFDATSAEAHQANHTALEPFGRLVIDLTPAAIGPYVVPAVNLAGLAGHRNLNMVTCGGQATIPIVAALAAPRALRRDRRLDRIPVGGAGHPGQHRRVHRDHRAPSSRWAGRTAARPSSC